MSTDVVEARVRASLVHFERLLARVPPKHYYPAQQQGGADGINSAFFKVRPSRLG